MSLIGPQLEWWGLFGRFRSWSNSGRDDHMVGTAAPDVVDGARSRHRSAVE